MSANRNKSRLRNSSGLSTRHGEITEPLTSSSEIDLSMVWTEEDLADLTLFALAYSEKSNEGKKKHSSRTRISGSAGH